MKLEESSRALGVDAARRVETCLVRQVFNKPRPEAGDAAARLERGGDSHPGAR